MLALIRHAHICTESSISCSSIMSHHSRPLTRSHPSQLRIDTSDTGSNGSPTSNVASGTLSSVETSDSGLLPPLDLTSRSSSLSLQSSHSRSRSPSFSYRNRSESRFTQLSETSCSSPGSLIVPSSQIDIPSQHYTSPLSSVSHSPSTSFLPVTPHDSRLVV